MNAANKAERSPKKLKVVVSGRVTPDIAKRIEQLAAEGHRSGSMQVELLILKGLEAMGITHAA